MDTSLLTSLLNIFSTSGFIEVQEYLSFESLYFVLLAYLLFYGAKKINDKVQTSFSLDYELLENDNKALAMSFVGYFFGIGIIIYSVITSPPSQYTYLENDFLVNNPLIYPLVVSTIDVLVWGLIGIILLNFSRILNDKMLLPKFSNLDEIIRDRNVGTGAVQLGSYISSALVIAALINHGGSQSLILDILLMILYFIISQILLGIFALVYATLVTYPLHTEIEKDNAAAGIAYGLNLIAISIFFYYPLNQTENLWVVLASFVNGVVFLTLSRWVFNKIILHKSDINHEIKNDRNWGIAFLEGTVAIMIALVVNGSFL